MEKNLNQRKSAVLKIALFGPESTGKTTLAKQLAEHFNTAWVAEYAREYLQKKWDLEKKICDINDMLPIAYGQTALENAGIAAANKYLFCDTNLMVTKVFSEVYYDYVDPLLDQAAREHEYDLFFLTDIDVPWEKDDLRDMPEGRESVFAVFKQSLIDNNKPFIKLSGDKNSRLQKAISIVDDLTTARDLGFSSIDFIQIYEHEIPIDNIKNQLNFFRNGIPKSNLTAAATILDGILKLDENELETKTNFYDQQKDSIKLLKFVPASGAASRMFKFLCTFLNEFDIENESINAYINRKKDSELSIFIVGLEKFPFFKTIDRKLKELHPDFETLSRDYKNYRFIQLLLSSEYFDFANKPKGTLPFHKYKKRIATPVEEHIYEGRQYASSDNISNLHFTVSPAHLSQFEAIINAKKEADESQKQHVENISFSYQDSKTDTIAVDLENNPFRDENGQLLFRPGGHGALIENLNQLDADLIFIKNIDNVLQNNIDKTAKYKKALAGILINIQQKVFGYLEVLEQATVSPIQTDEIKVFMEQQLCIKTSIDFTQLSFEDKIASLKSLLNRPIRVCGMVKNEGEAGGGPFWVQDEEGIVSLQIVESSQVDLDNEIQNQILQSSTHFNPVDLVCGIKNYKKEKFDLTQFVDHNSGFIVEKTTNGRIVKSYELPGLWNGAMAKWITLFVQVPLVTFNPVKCVNDLLKSAHQPKN